MSVMREDRPVPLDSEIVKRLKRAAAMQERWLVYRDLMIVEAHAAGGSLREIGALAGLSHVGVMKIVAKYQGLEAAHIKPLSEGGTDTEDNVVFLTAEENREARDQ